MAVPMLSRAVFRSRAPSWRSLLLTINLSHVRHVTGTEDSMLQMAMSAVTVGTAVDVSAEMEDDDELMLNVLRCHLTY